MRPMEVSVRLLKCSGTFWLCWWLLDHCANRTQKLDLVLGFKTDAINRAGIRSDVYGSTTGGSAGDREALWVLGKVIHGHMVKFFF